MATKPSFDLKLKTVKEVKDEDGKTLSYHFKSQGGAIKMTIKGAAIANSLGFEEPGTWFKLVVTQVKQTTLPKGK